MDPSDLLAEPAIFVNGFLLLRMPDGEVKIVLTEVISPGNFEVHGTFIIGKQKAEDMCKVLRYVIDTGNDADQDVDPALH